MSDEKLFAPWRREYVKEAKDGTDGCVFCELPEGDDDKDNLILFRGNLNYLVLNKYPYNPGHAMVVPFDHVGDYTQLDEETIKERYSIEKMYIEAARSVFDPDGFNVGMNLGRTAGAGVDDHIHVHLVPRWNGDNNFMPVISDTRVISQSLKSAYEELNREL
ncbi:MAG: HIT family hydrolase [Candidatus Methanohalarchaeum thermophilum]|uniref:HIT family hydrolase n=1 Tax=Methanohalarchaeum thermophilum TaxID=1903181 RepID=A0A1Q6DXW5_METT1|nr:MAG: HIT family hydrolase [Candidatus Methanohalarchaeum thermophilum]